MERTDDDLGDQLPPSVWDFKVLFMNYGSHPVVNILI